MISKAAFMIQENVRRHYVMITDVWNPNTFFVRGRLPFPQGMMAIAAVFKNQCPADVYAHPYFIEKQSDPSQPSPQLHLTEESQGIMKVMSGLRYMRDDNAKLDNTMVVVTDYNVEVEGRMPRVPQAASPSPSPAGLAMAPAQEESHGGLLEDKLPAGKSAGTSSGLTLEQRAKLRRPVHRAAQVPYGGGSAGLGLGSPAATGMQPYNASDTKECGVAGATTAAVHQKTPGYSSFPTPEDCAMDAWMSYRYLKAAILGGRELQEVGEDSPTRGVDASALFEERTGGYTVVYNPIEVDERTFVELLLKCKREERVVRAVVVPTRPAWRHLQVWADIFPDAELITSGEVPLIPGKAGWPSDTGGRAGAGGVVVSESDATNCLKKSTEVAAAALSGSATSITERRGGCQDMGNGMLGLSFPEVDWHAEAALEKQRAEEAAAKAEAMAQAAAVAAQRERQHSTALRQNRSSTPDTSGPEQEEEEEDSRDGDPVDVLWRDATFFTEKRAQAIGLREGDASRLRILSPLASTMTKPPVEALRLTPTIELLRIAGDSVTEEYVLFDANSNTLACTDLYHGEYADLDPANSWMCRVWFKLMKRGNYKRKDLVPRYKWLQVRQQNSLHVIQSALDDLTRQRPIQCILSAHGTPPLDGMDAVNTLRAQWNLPPLHPTERGHRAAASEKEKEPTR